MNFSNSFPKNTQTSNFIEIRPVGAELLHADRRTDMMKLIAAFRSFANAPKKLGQKWMPRSILGTRATDSSALD